MIRMVVLLDGRWGGGDQSERDKQSVGTRRKEIGSRFRKTIKENPNNIFWPRFNKNNLLLCEKEIKDDESRGYR